MKVIVYASILSAFSALGSAVNVNGFAAPGCPTGTAYVKCTGLPARTCCFTTRGSGGALSGVISYKPDNAVLAGYLRSRTGQNCGAQVSVSGTGGSQACINSPSGTHYGGLGWFKNAKKRSEEETCTSSVNADTLVLADGHQFNLTDMDDKHAIELWDLAVKKVTVEDLPAKFHKFETV